MDKKLIDIEYLNKEKNNFRQYLYQNIDSEAKLFLDQIAEISDTYIFSGVIRDYFIKYRGTIRDLDIVFKTENDDQLNKILSTYKYKINSFGGYKIEIGDLNIDFWSIDNTWALNISKLYLDLDKYRLLPKTSFFNFSSIIFDLKKSNFIASTDFFNFLKNRKIDYVLEENPLPILCIVNSIYYSRKYNLKISNRLKKYYVRRFENYSEKEYNEIQLKHFNEVLFPFELLKVYNQIFKKNIKINE